MLLGFLLLGLLVLGAAVFSLSLIFLGTGAGIQLFGWLIGGGPGWIVTLATGVQVAAGAAFALGIVMIAIGLAAFLFPAIRLFIRGLLVLLRLAASELPNLVQGLRRLARLLDGAGRLLIDPDLTHDPPDPANQPLTKAGASLVSAGNNVPDIPTLDLRLQTFFVTRHDGQRTGGLVENPFGLPNVSIPVDPVKGSADANVFKTALTTSGTLVGDVGANTADVGRAMREAAAALDQIATLME